MPVLLLMALLSPSLLFAQYYDQGQMPFSIKWRYIKQDQVRVVYPDYFEKKAVTVMGLLDTVRRSVSYGMTHGAINISVILKTENPQSNGVVMWAPRRMELITMPDINTYALPWLKQLASHESRHLVQYSNLNRHFLKGLSYVLGEQAGFLGLALVPLWYIEGDAVMTETQMATFGRALQPSFTMDYRAYFTEGKMPRFTQDKWFCGSYKDNIPDHYHMGYLMVNHSHNLFGKNVWNDVSRYTSKYPYLLFTTNIALKKYYGSSVRRIYKDMMPYLENYWRSIPIPEPSGERIPTRTTSYTTYTNPIPVDDKFVVAFKKDMDRPGRLVKVDLRTRKEKVLSYTGLFNTHMSRRGTELLWTEYRSSLFWEQRQFSVVCKYDFATGRVKKITRREIALYPLRMPDGELSYISYDYTGFYKLHVGDRTFDLPDTLSVHGLAYDDISGRMAFIGLSDAGMWIGDIDINSGRIQQLTAPSSVTISDLRASWSKLYYGSIESGRDEVHVYDLTSGRESRITTSPYGSFDGAVSNSGTLYYTTYSRRGYLLAKQKITEDSLKPVSPSLVPQNVINPPMKKWEGMLNLDTVKIEPSAVKHSAQKRFNNGLRLFNVHSWAPIEYDPNQIFDKDEMGYRAGFTIMSQSLLSNMMSYVSYGWADGDGRLRASLQYYGMAPKFDLTFQYGGGYSSVVGGPSAGASKHTYFSIDASVFMPFNLSGGYWHSQITPLVTFSHTNDRLYDPAEGDYSSGYDKLLSRIQFASNTRLAERDFLPKWGVMARGTNINAPLVSSLSNLWSLFGRAFLPGVMRHHSTSIRCAVQTQSDAYYSFKFKELLPRGASDDFAARRYLALSGDYQFPLWCPDYGINSILYFKRIRLNLSYDFARYQGVASMNPSGRYTTLTSYGGDVIMDISPLRAPGTAITVSIGVNKPSDRKGVVVSFDLNIPL